MALFGGRFASAQTLEERVARLEALAEETKTTPSPEEEELAKLRLELQLPETFGRTYTGFGPAVSKAYFSRTPLTIGSFGEVFYTTRGDGFRNTNLARLNLFLGYRFSHSLLFNSGLAFQNGGSVGASGAARVEFAYLDFIMGEEAGVRAGNLLIPFGITNLRFDPTSFPTVNRPRPDLTIIPTTWHENGIIGYGKIGTVILQAGVVNSLSAEGFETPTWIRGGRQGGSLANASDAGLVFRAEHLDDHSSLGMSFFSGDTGQGNDTIGDARLLMGAIHGEYRFNRFAAQALYVEGALSDTARILTLPQPPSEPPPAIGRRARGAFLSLSYDLLAATSSSGTPTPDLRGLPIFVSWEHDDVAVEPAEGTAANPALRTDVYSIGVNYKPHPQVVIKTSASYQTDGAGANQRLLEAGIGYVF